MVKPGLKSRVAWICGGAYPAGHPSRSHRHNPCLLQSAKPLTFNSIKLKDLKEASKNGRKLLLIMNSVWVDFTMFTFREKNWTVYLLLQGIGSLRAVHSPSVMSNSLRPMNLAHQAPLSMGILQARTLEWVAMPSSRGSSQPRGQTEVSHTAGGFFTIWVPYEDWTRLDFLFFLILKF